MRQLCSKAVILFYFEFFLNLLFIGIFAGFFFALVISSSIETLAWILVTVVVGVTILAYLWARLTYYFYRYELTDEGFRKERGVLFKKYVTIPYDRIQNIDIYRGIFDRILGLSVLSIQTAGSNTGAEGSLPGLSREVAEQLRSELVARIQHSKDQGL